MAGSIMLDWKERLDASQIALINSIIEQLEDGEIDLDEAYDELVNYDLVLEEIEIILSDY